MLLKFFHMKWNTNICQIFTLFYYIYFDLNLNNFLSISAQLSLD